MSFKNKNLPTTKGDDMLKKGKKPDDDKGFAFDRATEQKTLKPVPSPPSKATFVEMNILSLRAQ
jgi:hypothetical protein